MKISIVTAVRNAASTVTATLQSMAGQSYASKEHIVVDGASTDGTLAQIAAHEHSLSKVVSERDRGVYDAFNKGLALCSGEIVGFLNAADTYTSPEVLARVADEFQDRRVRVVFGDVSITDPSDGRVVRHYCSAGFRPQRLRWGFMPAHPAMFIRRDVYDQFGGYDVNYRIAGDFELAARLLCRHAIPYSYIRQTMVFMPTGGLSTGGWKSNWIITQEMQRACAQNGISTSLPRLLLRLPIKLLERFSKGHD